MLYMLDTNIASYIIRKKPPTFREKLTAIPPV
jgi:predicted nucleic acid-binding protein